MSVFGFIAEKKAEHTVKTLCRVLGVSRSGFHAWERRAPSERALHDARLSERIRALHERSRDSYGARRIHLDLRDENVRVGRKRVERLMRKAGLSGYVKRRKGTTTIRVAGVSPAEDLVDRNFVAGGHQLWMSDIKEIPTWQGKLYLASVIDCFSRKVVGWSMRDNMQAELVVDALEMGISRRQPAGKLVHHSDHGSQYVALIQDAMNAYNTQNGLTSTDASYLKLNQALQGNSPLLTRNNDFVADILHQNAPISSHSLSVSGATDQLNYFLSGGYFQQNAVVKRWDLTRLTFRANSDYTVNRIFKFGEAISASYHRVVRGQNGGGDGFLEYGPFFTAWGAGKHQDSRSKIQRNINHRSPGHG